MNPSSQTIAKLTAGFVLLAGLCHADPLSVTQGLASQRAGTRLVDVSYDLSGGVPPYSVTLQGSLDGGVTWTLPVATVSGNVGSVATAGTNRLVTWDAGTDWNGQVSANVKFRVNVTDSAAPTGFERIPAGNFTMGDQSNPLVGYGSAYYSDPSAGTNPQGPLTGSDRVIRGGHRQDHADIVRCAARGYKFSGVGYVYGAGFRLARGQP